MQRLKTLNEINQKRLVRGDYVHHQATPYAVTLDPSLRNTDGSIRKPLAADTTPLTRAADAYTLNNSLIPGLVLVRTVGELVTVATGSTSVNEYPFGLNANWLGGDYDDIGTENAIGCWRGPDSTYTLLAPAYVDTGLAAAVTASSTTGAPITLCAGTDGRLKYVASPTATQVVVAHLIDRPSATRIVIDLKV